MQGYISDTKADHSGGTKFYRIWTVSFANRSVCVFEYGPIGGTSQFNVKTYEGALTAGKAANAQKHAKEKRGYGPWTTAREQKVSSPTDLADRLKGRWTHSVRDQVETFLGLHTIATEPDDEPKAPIKREPKVDRSGDKEWGSW